MADHDASRDAARIVDGDKHVRARAGPGETEIRGGVVVGRDQIAGTPQRDDGRFVVGGGASDGDGHGQTLWWWAWHTLGTQAG
jgi:hypothetical protein